MIPDTILTIVIVNYKTAGLVCDAVKAAKDHARADGVGIKIAVVDNGSNDNSVQVISAAHPDIEVIDSGANLGFSAGNNLVLKSVTTPYVMLLNSDAFIQDGTLKLLVNFMERNRRSGIIGPRILNPDGTDQDYPCRFPTILEMMTRALKGPQFPAKGSTGQPIPMERIHGCCLMIRRAVLEQIGPLDEQFFMYDEDMDWCLRCKRAGWEIYLLPDASVIHLGGQTSGRAPSGMRKTKTLRSFNPRMSYELRKSRYILYKKYRTFPELVVLKIMTDVLLFAGCLLLLPEFIKGQDDRQYALKRLKANVSIMAINPFRLVVRVL